MIRSFWIACALIFLGLLWTGYPDKGAVLFNIIANTGPSLSDAVGLAVVFLGWLVLLIHAISNRQKILSILGADGIKRMIIVIALGKALLYVGLRWHIQLVLWTGVLIMVLAYVAVCIPAFRKN